MSRRRGNRHDGVQWRASFRALEVGRPAGDAGRPGTRPAPGRRGGLPRSPTGAFSPRAPHPRAAHGRL